MYRLKSFKGSVDNHLSYYKTMGVKSVSVDYQFTEDTDWLVKVKHVTKPYRITIRAGSTVDLHLRFLGDGREIMCRSVIQLSSGPIHPKRSNHFLCLEGSREVLPPDQPKTSANQIGSQT